MDASDANRVLVLTNQITTIQRVLELLDEGATISGMILRRRNGYPAPVAEPASGEEAEPPGLPGGEPGQPSEMEGPTEPEPAPLQESPEEPEGGVGDITVSTEGMTYPPQMIEAIRQQELVFWRTAYDELERLGVTNVSAPPA